MPDASKSTPQRLLFLTLLILAYVLLIRIFPAAAAPQDQPLTKAGDITISPTVQDITINSGLVEARTKLTLTNHTNRDLTASIEPTDFDASGQSGAIAWDNPTEAGNSNKYGLVKWLVLPGGNTVFLPKGQTVNVPVHIENRDDLAPGGHYAGLIVRPGTVTDAVGNRVNFKQELISLLFVKKLGGAKFGLQLSSIESSSKHDIPTEVSLKFRSTGNVYVVPRGYVTVTDPHGKIVSKGTINSDSNMILPETSRKQITLMQPMADPSAKGKFKITAYYRYDGQPQFDSQSVYFNRGGLPVVVVITVLITVVTAILIVYKLHRTRRK